MSGGEADVKNSIWMRAVLYGGVFLAVGILAFATMSVGVANVKHADWDEKKLDYERVTEQYTEATADYTQANETYNQANETYNQANATYNQANANYTEAADDSNTTSEQLEALRADKEEKKQIKLQLSDEKYDAKMDKVDAHLSYLTWRTAGITILLMCVTYMAFIGLGGFMNSIYPEDQGHDDHGYGGDDHEHHGSGSPIVFSLGILLFLMGFPMFANTLSNMLSGIDSNIVDLG